MNVIYMLILLLYLEYYMQSAHRGWFIHSLCIQFARRGMNVVLVSRAYDDLVRIVSDLRE